MEKVNTMNITTEINKLITNLQKSNNDKLKKENLKYKGTVVGGGPGSICFMHGAFSPMAIDEVRHFPEEGDFFIFPYNVKHYVSPFLSKCVRISVAANYTIDVTNEKQKSACFFGSYEKN